MTPEFLAAVIDSLLPGEMAASGGRQALPAGTAAGLDPVKYGETFPSLLQAIAQAAGGTEAFVSADEAARVKFLQAVQRAQPDGFARLLGSLLPDYYESAAVLAAFGWRTAPPQPEGHEVAPMAQDVAQKLDRVRQRGPRWRG